MWGILRRAAADPVDPDVELAHAVIGGRQEPDDSGIVMGHDDPMTGHHVTQQVRALLLHRVRICHADTPLEACSPHGDELDGVVVAIERSDLEPRKHLPRMAGTDGRDVGARAAARADPVPLRRGSEVPHSAA